MQILIAPDKFKGSLSAAEVIDAIAKGLLETHPHALIHRVPMSDGGEGALEIIKDTTKSVWCKTVISDPLFRPIEGRYLIAGNTAYIEMSLASGLQLLSKSESNPMNTSSYGTGQLIKVALEQKAVSNIVLFIGGSATNDLGIGMATALGYKFLNRHGQEVLPIGRNMHKIVRIDTNHINRKLLATKIEVISDVDNPLYGHMGAAYQYAAQKGANINEIIALDNGLRHLSEIILKHFNLEICDLPGAGGAGGLGGGAITFLQANRKSGTSFFIKLLNLEALIQSSDIVISGEGLLDDQTYHGKVINGLDALCHSHNKRFILYCGQNNLSEECINTQSKGREIHEIISLAENKADAMSNASHYLKMLARKVKL